MKILSVVGASLLAFPVFAPVFELMAAAGAPSATAVRIRVLQGERAEFRAGSTVPRPLLVEVTDETGRPLEGAVVAFRLPEQEPSGLFSNGLRTDITITGADGRAAPGAIRWGDAPGVVEIRITAAKAGARAGLVVEQILSGAAAQSGGTPPTAASGGDLGLPPFKPRRSWLKVAMVAGVAAAGAAAGLGWVKRNAGEAATGAASDLSIGTPSVTIGGPR
ncbi:MAG: hypothetical protein RMK57_11250 [Bryobacterales bacterium]|nr:hypothetical protein [Bryobacteraceae bacterium]MDW8355095.1 hypothetical protein [Bryobacterales bacterium]